MTTKNTHQKPDLQKAFRIMFEQSPYSNQIYAPNGQSLFANKACRQLWGITQKQIQGYNILKDPQIYTIGIGNDIQKAFAGEAVYIPAHKYEPKKTIAESKVSHRWVQDLLYPIKDSHGKVLYVVMQHEDVTEKMDLEQRKEDFYSIASHELKTPVTSVIMFLQLLQKHMKEKDDKFSLLMLEKVDKQMRKMTKLINDLLDLAKVQHNQLTFEKEIFPVTDLIKEVVENLQMTTTNHHISIKEQTTATMYADRDRITQVLVNIIANAIKYSPRSHEIFVSSKKVKKEIIIKVQDFGIGITKDDQKKIFERFFRANGEIEKTYPGFGIGLYISHNIVTKHNGKIAVKSEKNAGSTFLVTLPAT